MACYTRGGGVIPLCVRRVLLRKMVATMVKRKLLTVTRLVTMVVINNYLAWVGSRASRCLPARFLLKLTQLGTYAVPSLDVGQFVLLDHMSPPMSQTSNSESPGRFGQLNPESLNPGGIKLAFPKGGV